MTGLDPVIFYLFAAEALQRGRKAKWKKDHRVKPGGDGEEWILLETKLGSRVRGNDN